MSDKQKLSDKKKFFFRAIYFFIFVGICFRFYIVFEYPPLNNIFSDPARHWTLAQNLFTLDPMAVIDPIGYQLWLSAVLWLTKKDPLAIALYTWILSSITPFFWYLFFRELTGNKLISLVGWLILTWLPSWIGIFSYFMVETLLLPLLGLTLFLTWKSLKKNGSVEFLVSSFLWVLASVTKLISFPLAIISFIFYFFKKGFQLKKVIILFFIFSIFLIPLSYRSYKSLGVYAPLGFPLMNQIYQQSGKKIIKFNILGRGLWVYSSPSLYSNPFDGLFDWSSRRQGTVEFEINTKNGINDWNKALKRNAVDLKTRLIMTCENIVFLLFSSSWPDNNKNYFVENLSIKMRWIWAPFLLLVFVFSSFYCIKNKKLPLIIILNLAAWLICFLSPSGVMEGRYRKPLEGLLIANLLFFVARNKQSQNISFDELKIELPKH